jgi:hypothetical protein
LDQDFEINSNYLAHFVLLEQALAQQLALGLAQQLAPDQKRVTRKRRERLVDQKIYKPLVICPCVAPGS